MVILESSNTEAMEKIFGINEGKPGKKLSGQTYVGGLQSFNY